MKKCNKCEKYLDYSEFSKYKRSKDGFKNTCKKCISNRRRELRISKGENVRIDRSSETLGNKICTKCKKILPISEYSTNQSWCNKCRAAQNRDRVGSTKKLIPKIEEDAKECLECREMKLLTEFYNSKRGRLGKGSYCKACQNKRFKQSKEYQNEVTKRYRARHRERYLSDHRIHQFNRKSKIKASSDGSIDDLFLKELYSIEQCYYCKKYIDQNDRTLDHKMPLSKGGVHSKENCVMACFSCNSSKGSKTDVEFLKILYDKEKDISKGDC